MTRGEKAIVLWLASAAGIVLLALGGVFWFPGLMREKARIQQVRDRLMDQRTLEAEAQAFIQDVKDRVGRLASDSEDLEERVGKETFHCLPDTEIPAFVEELQAMFAAPGLQVLNLAYQPRTTEDEFVTLPFEARVEATYTGLRLLLHTLESHAGRLRIHQLEFQAFDNVRHHLEVKLSCTVRFARHG